jgi:3-methyladenine DNA glycosylase AlkD
MMPTLTAAQRFYSHPAPRPYTRQDLLDGHVIKLNPALITITDGLVSTTDPLVLQQQVYTDVQNLLAHAIRTFHVDVNFPDYQGFGPTRPDINTAVFTPAFVARLNKLVRAQRKIAKSIGTDHALAPQLWNSGIHEARILASYIADPQHMSETQIEQWVADFDSWDVCDQVVALFSRTPFAYFKVTEWAQRPQEFVKRAAFALIAELTAHDKHASDEQLAQFFPVIVRASDDDRNFVKKVVNWALRSLGKRNRALNEQTIATAHQIQALGTRPARWIAADALRELTGERKETSIGRDRFFIYV